MSPQVAVTSMEEKKVENKDVRILVVDDEPVMADSLRQNFIEEGYSVDTAATGAAAIELFDQGGHHLAICDLQLPDMDGLEVMRHMKDARPTTEVIVVTGYGTVQKAVEATKAGAFYFVDAPAQCPIAGKIVDDAFALGLFRFNQNGLLFGGRGMGRHCPSVQYLNSVPTAQWPTWRSIT